VNPAADAAAGLFLDKLIGVVITGLDPVIHLLRKKNILKIDGCPDQVRA
jgi:hypothetical protein